MHKVGGERCTEREERTNGDQMNERTVKKIYKKERKKENK